MRAQDRYKTIVLVMVTLVSILIMSGVAQAALVKLSVPRMTRLSHSVVVGEVVSVTPRYVPSADGVSLPTIQTVVRIRVDDALKGRPGIRVTVRVPGGAIGDERLVVEEAPTFRRGETCLVFLDTRGRVVGWQQGKVEVVDGRVPQWGASLGVAKARVRAAAAGGASTRATAPRRVETGPVSLTLTAEELAAAQAAAGSVTGASTRATSTILSDGFESGMTNWTLSGNRSWGRTTQRAQAGSYSAYCVQGTTAAPGPYTSGSDSRMVYGPFDLSNATAATIVFDEWFSLGASDGIYYLTSTDGASFFGEGYSGSSGSWYRNTVDLANVPTAAGGVRGSRLGQSQVWLMFRFVSDAAATNGEGAYIDNVTISKDYAGASDPTITSISPGTGSAGTGTSVTLTGTNFGAAQGAGKVEFFYRSGQPKISAPVTSWSATQIVCTIPTGDVGGYPASAASGPVTVTTNAGLTSAGYDFTVTFGYGGVKWASPALSYRFNPSTGDSSQEEALFDAAWATWNKPSLFLIGDAGSCTTTAYPPPHDGNNDVFFTTDADIPAGALAVNAYWYSGSNIVESDIAFNDAYTWNDGSGGSYDIQSTATHELGHSLNLRDLYGAGDSANIMYGFGSVGEIKRTLHADDVAGAVWIYGARPAMSGTMRANSDAAWTRLTTVSLNSSVGNASQMRFQNQGGSWSGWEAYAATKSGWSVGAGDGTKTVNAEYRDAGGNIYTQSDAIGLDATAPVTGDNGAGVWHKPLFGLVLSPADGGSGMSGGSALTEYSTDGGSNWTTGTALSFVGWRRGGGTGTYTVLVRSTDAVGNAESPRSVTVLVDSRAPSTTDNAPAGAQAGPVTVTFTGVDTDSGIKEIWYSVDGGSWTQGGSALIPAPADHSNDGRHTIRYYAVDNAGNAQVGYRVCSVTIAT